MDHAHCNWNEIMGHIQASHEITTYLSALLSPTMTAIMIICAGFISHQLMIMYAPQDGLNPDSYIMQYHIQSLMYPFTVVMLITARLPFFIAAGSTSACQNLIDAVAALRIGKNTATGELRDTLLGLTIQ